MEVSVVIPAYNAAATIGRAIDSVLAQTRSVGEIIVVDDGSRDDLVGALRRFGAGVRLVRQPNRGVSAARNRGIETARADWVMFLDADDEWAPHKVEAQLEAARAHPDVGMIGGRFRVAWDDDPAGRLAGPDGGLTGVRLTPGAATAFSLALGTFTGVVAIRRDLLAASRFDEGLRIAEDRDLWFRLLIQTPSFYLPDVVAVQHASLDSLSHADIDLDYSSMLRVIERHREVLPASEVRSVLTATYRNWAGTWIARGSPRRAIRPAWERLRLQPASAEAWWVLAKAVIRGLRVAVG
jgi:glycosyltransferase involved in cell wall biosynthesis